MFFLSAIHLGNWQQAYLALNGTSTHEMLRLLNQIDRAQLTDLTAAAESMTYKVNLPRIAFAATVVSTRKIPSDVPNDPGDLSAAKAFLVNASPLLLPRDPTGTFPQPVPHLPALTTDDFKNAAKAIGAEAAAIRAVADVESGGNFGADGRPIVRFELHTFQERTKGKYHQTHPHLSNTYKIGRTHHTGGQANEWSMIYGAALLRGCAEHAAASASWGMFQIMGFNCKTAGFGTALALAESSFFSASNQLRAFVDLCKGKGWNKYLVSKDWAGFALHYNGKDYKKNQYDDRLAAAYQRHAAASA